MDWNLGNRVENAHRFSRMETHASIHLGAKARNWHHGSRWNWKMEPETMVVSVVEVVVAVGRKKTEPIVFVCEPGAMEDSMEDLIGDEISQKEVEVETVEILAQNYVPSPGDTIATASIVSPCHEGEFLCSADPVLFDAVRMGNARAISPWMNVGGC